MHCNVCFDTVQYASKEMHTCLKQTDGKTQTSTKVARHMCGVKQVSAVDLL